MPGIDPRGGGRVADAVLTDARRRAAKITRDAEREAAAIRREAAAWAASTRRAAEEHRDRILGELELLAQRFESETDTLVVDLLHQTEDAGPDGDGEVIDLRRAVGGGGTVATRITAR